MTADMVGSAGSFPAPVANMKAVVAAAPGFSFRLDPSQMAVLDAAIQIWGAEADARVLHETNIAPLAAALEAPSVAHVIDAAGHFTLPPPCYPALEQANPRVWEMACVDAPGFDGGAFQERFNRSAVGFLATNLLEEDP